MLCAQSLTHHTGAHVNADRRSLVVLDLLILQSKTNCILVFAVLVKKWLQAAGGCHCFTETQILCNVHWHGRFSTKCEFI